MNGLSSGSVVDLLTELLAGSIANAAATVIRWAYIGWYCFLGYVVLVFLLAATGYQQAAFFVYTLIPALGIAAVFFAVPTVFVGMLVWPNIRETRVGSLVHRLSQRLARGVMGGGWFAFSLGCDVSDIMRFRWSHPWLATLLCIFAVPAVMRELREDSDWGFWGTGAFIVSLIVLCLNLLEFLRGG